VKIIKINKKFLLAILQADEVFLIRLLHLDSSRYQLEYGGNRLIKK